jgi:sulfate adenylyltransferase large subunit
MEQVMSGLLRICTAGSVDDGKSTLIGRLLYDSQSVYEDQVHSVEKASKNRNAGPIDFSLFTDGLRAEREQGITIDVAYRYFATARRKFILADTPGHEQYTRNMATGASTADVAILLVDARHGVRVQSRRHARIARLLGIQDFVLAINKMDLVDFDRDVYDAICDDFEEILVGARAHAIPLSALHGDNVITHSDRTPWFEGPSLLEYLETVDVTRDLTSLPLRFPVQLVLRPDHAFRGYGGQIVSGAVRVGDRLTAWPSGRSARVSRVVTYDGDLDYAFAPMSVTLTLDDEIDISRGDILAPFDPSKASTASQERSKDGFAQGVLFDPAHGGPVRTAHGAPFETGQGASPTIGTEFEAEVVWMDERPADPGRVYLIKQATRTVTAELHHGLVLNQIGTVNISTARPLVFDRYTDNRATGSFIVIDPATHFTAGAGMIVNPLHHSVMATAAPISAAERLAVLARHAGSDAEAVEAVRKALEELLA